MEVTNLFKHWTYKVFAPGTLLRKKYAAFRELIKYDNRSLELIADLEEISYGSELVDYARVPWLASRLSESVSRLIQALMDMEPVRYGDLPEYARKIDFYVRMGLDLPQPEVEPPYLLDLRECAGREDLCGGKAANLAVVASDMGLPVPPARVVTTSAWGYFLESNGLAETVHRHLRHVTLSRPEDIASHCRRVQEAILEAEVPEVVAEALSEAAEALAPSNQTLALRSSAVSEDGEVSFAGQFASELDVPRDGVLAAYRRVLASKYSPRAVTYRILNGLADEDVPMAVLMMPMVDAESAGVMYTRDPDRAKGSESSSSRLALYAVHGQGRNLVEGGLTPEVYRFTRSEDPELTGREWSEDSLGLPLDTARQLARLGMKLERVFNSPQDVEWAVDRRQRLFLLQSRPIASEKADAQDDEGSPFSMDEDAEVLAQGLTRISSGMGCGPYHVAESVVDASKVPEGVVLAVATLSPALVRVVGHVAAVVSRAGSRGSHFASVSREFGLPVVVGEELDLEGLEQGQVVTVDADQGLILAGCPEGLDKLKKKSSRGRVPERLAGVMERISSLNLTDPDSSDFSPEKARSFHDLVRFCHEKGVAAMFSLVDKGGKGLSGAKKLKSDLPLTMYVLDVGGGLFKGAGERGEVTPNDFKSQPLWSFWWGLSDPGVKWSQAMPHMDWEGFDKHSAGIFKHDAKFLASYVVAAESYLHAMIRFGYHFSVVDAYCDERPDNNYINFRFKGGGASMDQRLLRLEFISRVLGHFGFGVTTRGDLLDATCSRKGANETLKRLAELGYILAITRLMDMGLTELSQVDAMVENFIENRERD